jgi:thymidine phosphorylase
MFLPQEIVRKKRDGQALSKEDIVGFVRGIAEGSVTEGQVAAFAMAVYFNDMRVKFKPRIRLLRAACRCRRACIAS